MGKYTASDGTEFDTKREWRKYEFELSFTFKNKKNEQLSKEAGKIEGQPFDIAECEGCEIVITDHCDQVQIDQLKTCRVFLGASSESVFVRDCSDCTFYLACKQLRTRDCHNCTFYLYAKTEPIIELSDGISFAPFLGGYPEQAQHMKSANLDPSYNLWWGVFDFNDEFKTLNHWKYLDEKERKPWFPRGGSDQICACPPPGDAAALPSQTGGNFGSSGGMMSFGFNTSLVPVWKSNFRRPFDATSSAYLRLHDGVKVDFLSGSNRRNRPTSRWRPRRRRLHYLRAHH